MTDGTDVGPTSAGGCAAYAEDARCWLAAVLVGVGESDCHTALIVGEALSVLNEVTPPLPPLRYPDGGVPGMVGIGRALEALAQAGAVADRVADASRFAHAARILARHLAAGA